MDEEIVVPVMPEEIFSKEIEKQVQSQPDHANDNILEHKNELRLATISVKTKRTTGKVCGESSNSCRANGTA